MKMLRLIVSTILLMCGTNLRAGMLDLGTMAKIEVDGRLGISVVVDLGRRSRGEVAANFLADPSRASRFTRGSTMTIPFDELADPYRAIAVLRLFPNDRTTDDGVVHVVTRDEETRARLADIYTGTTRNAGSIALTGTVGEVSVTRRHEIIVTIAREGVDQTALANAVLKDPSKIRRAIQGSNIVISAEDMKDAYRGAALNHLFHRDELREDARRHKVILNIETLYRLSLWFTGSEGNWQRLKNDSHKRSNQVAIGETIIIKRELLGDWAQMTEDDIAAETAAYPLALTSRSRRGELIEGQQLLVPKRYAAGWTKLLENGEDGAQDAAKWYVYRGMTNGPLTYDADEEGGFALYRLRRGEALYSSVVVRFTGIMEAAEVMSAARQVMARSGYRDPRRIPANARIKIPMAFLGTEWRPEGDPARLAELQNEQAVAQIEQEIRQERREASRRSSALRGITVILDAGHGGRDPGALGSGGLTENEVVYDIMCRTMNELSRRTQATVHVTIEDRQTRHNPSSSQIIRDNREEYLRTTPAYPNDNIVKSANLRWYLANSYVRRSLRDGTDLDNVVFTSLHADALHASVSGAMVYIPSASHCSGRYQANRSYTQYREVQERRTVSYSNNERLRAQALSTTFAERLVRSLRSKRVAVHPNKSVRGYIIRSARSRPWVPAVIKYNAAPTKILVEIGNIKNRDDVANMRSPQWRQRFAEAYVDALIAHFGS